MVPVRLFSIRSSNRTRPFALSSTPYHSERGASVTQLVLVTHNSPLVASKNAVSANSSRFIVVRGADALSCCRVAVISTVPSPTA